MIHLDSCLLIDLAREARRDRPGPAFELLESFDDDEILAVSVHVVAELRAGAELAKKPRKEHEELDQLLSGLLVVYPDAKFSLMYARLFATAASRGKPMAAMDLLIATAARLDDAPLVTNSVRDFSRVPGLKLIEY